MIPKHHYCLLPSGNKNEFPRMEMELRRLKVGAYYMRRRHGGRWYRVPSNKVKNLPKWKGEPYIPVADGHGHGMYTIRLSIVNQIREKRSIWIKL